MPVANQNFKKFPHVCLGLGSFWGTVTRFFYFAFITIFVGCTSTGNGLLPLSFENRAIIDQPVVVIVNRGTYIYGYYEFYTKKGLANGMVYLDGLQKCPSETFQLFGGGPYVWKKADLEGYFKNAKSLLSHRIINSKGVLSSSDLAMCVADSMRTDFRICGVAPLGVERFDEPTDDRRFTIAKEHNADTVLVVEMYYMMKHTNQGVECQPVSVARLNAVGSKELIYERTIKGNY